MSIYTASIIVAIACAIGALIINHYTPEKP